MLTSINNKASVKSNKYPYALFNFDQLNLAAPVVFFTGNNGSGKSTVLAAIASLANAINLSGSDIDKFDYSQTLSLAFNLKLKAGYYLQAEDFYNFLSKAKLEQKEHQDLLDHTEARHDNKSGMGYLLESNLHKSNISAFKQVEDKYLNVSHGEGYINFFSDRLRANSLYLLDEPETPLSLDNQLSLIKLIDDAIKLGSQFVICTHSPILLAYPNAIIYDFSDNYAIVDYADHYIVKDYQNFLSNSNRFMHHLLK